MLSVLVSPDDGSDSPDALVAPLPRALCTVLGASHSLVQSNSSLEPCKIGVVVLTLQIRQLKLKKIPAAKNTGKGGRARIRVEC